MATPTDGTRDGALSIQERLYPQLTCFGCGHANPKGLHLRSYPDGDAVVAEFLPWPEHDNGFGFLNGGIIATLLDCHSGAAVYNATQAQGGPDGGMSALYVTAGLDVRYVRPMPLTEPVGLRAVLASVDADRILVEAELVWDGKPRAVATSDWRPWRPR
jgi:acyl-coenzyme A thioesterase PaaI-like protein